MTSNTDLLTPLSRGSWPVFLRGLTVNEQTVLTQAQAEAEHGRRSYERIMRGEAGPSAFDKVFQYIGSLSRETFERIMSQLTEAANGR